jgi:hypothetical protein
MMVSQLHRFYAAERKEHCGSRIGTDMEGNNREFNLPRGVEKTHCLNILPPDGKNH